MVEMAFAGEKGVELGINCLPEKVFKSHDFKNNAEVLSH